jgi:uncharacterized RDD family membrane protein YckC
MLIILVAIISVYLLLFSTDFDSDVAYSVATFLSFIIFNLYFIYFELAWRGRTPGKALVGLLVVNRHGGELTPTAIVARNLTRLIELYLPLFLLVTFSASFFGMVSSVIFFSWALLGTILPLITRDNLRLGDLIGGTMVIAKPIRVLADDLSQSVQNTSPGFTFTPDQLSIYGYFELRALEDILRRAEKLPLPKAAPITGLYVVANKIKNRIDYPGLILPGQERQFLADFYTAQRAVLERALLFGQQKWNQYLGLISISALSHGQAPPPATTGYWSSPTQPRTSSPPSGQPPKP